jgi:hypothetical protein
MARTCAREGCENLVPERKGKGRPRKYCSDACSRRAKTDSDRESYRRTHPGWEERRQEANELWADRLIAKRQNAFGGDPRDDFEVKRHGRTDPSSQEALLEDIHPYPHLHPEHVQKHEQTQNDHYRRQQAQSALDALLAPADPYQVSAGGGWTEAGVPYGNGATFGQNEHSSPWLQAVVGASADEAKVIAGPGGKITREVVSTVVLARAGVSIQRLQQKYGDRIQKLQSRPPADQKTVDPKAREMSDALVDLVRLEAQREESSE